MQRETEIACVKIEIQGDVIEFSSQPSKLSSFVFHREHAPALIAFIQQWLDNDPDEELIRDIQNIRFSSEEFSPIRIDKTKDIIAAVREHDAKYRRET